MTLKPGEVKTEHIANGAVTAPKIGDAQVLSSKLQDKSITTEKIANGAVTRGKIGEKQVSTSRLKDASVTTEKIATAAVTASKIADGQVTQVKLQDGSVVASKIGKLQVSTSRLQDGAVTTEKIADRAVTPAKLSFTPPPMSRPISPPVTNAELGNGSVTTEKITPQSVNREKLNDDVIAAFGHKFNFVSPWYILPPATYENAVPWEEIPLATHLPEGTFAVIIQLEISNPEMLSAVHIAMNPAPELRGWVNIRKDSSQESGLSVGYQSGTSGTVNFNQGIVPITDARTIEWELQGDFIPPPVKRVTVAIKLIGFII